MASADLDPNERAPRCSGRQSGRRTQPVAVPHPRASGADRRHKVARLNVALTGATGFLGHYILAELLARPCVRCHVVLRPPVSTSRRHLARLLADLGLDLDELIARERVVPLAGELPCALGASGFKGLDAIIHAAANTRFDSGPSGEPTRTNVEGTRAMLSVADETGVKRFVFISTAYVCGRRTGRIPETVSAQPPSFFNEYERSKWEAERLVRRWGRGSKVSTICRPSILFGDRRTGRATSMTGLYLVARATEILARAVAQDPKADRMRIPLRIRGRGDATSNAVPVCWAAGRIAAITLDHGLQGGVYHVTNPAPPSHAKIKLWLEDYFNIGGGMFTGSPEPISDPNHYEELFYSLGNTVGDYFRHGLMFESRLDRASGCARGLVDRESFFRCLRYAQATNWGRSARPGGRTDRATEGIDPRRYFEEFLPRTYPCSSVARMAALTTVVRFIITGEHQNEWVCRFDRGRLAEVREGTDMLREDFGYRVTADAFTNVVTGRKPLQAVFFQGAADIFGNIEKALKMVSVMREFISEFPAREF